MRSNSFPERYLLGKPEKVTLKTFNRHWKKMAEKNTTATSKRSRGADVKEKELVIVESPAKAKTINRYLGPDFVVMASVGHVRDLPDKNPKGVKDPVPGVDLMNDFHPTYGIIKGKGKTVTELKKAARHATGVWLATDLDREGEAIAWHLAEALGIEPGMAKRVVFNAITKGEIEKAFQNPRGINIDKVNAQQARRILDRIVGYQVSPLLWKKVAGGLSAGRVQSVATRLVVEREREIEGFTPSEYWKITGCFTILDKTHDLEKEWLNWLSSQKKKKNGKRFNGPSLKDRNVWLFEHDSISAELIEIGGGKFNAHDFETALNAAQKSGFILKEKIEQDDPKAKGPARRVITLKGTMSEDSRWKIKSIQTKRTKSHPPAPFITSTLQQTASNQLGFTAHSTMRIAQALYEGVPVADMGSVGLITYMRTDSTFISPEAINSARDYISSHLGGKYLPEKANFFSSSNKSAQEAHEAIRPTDVKIYPEDVRKSLKDNHYRLYKLIWERFVSSQISDAQWDATTVHLTGPGEGEEIVFRATGRVLVFDGFYKIAGAANNHDDVLMPYLEENRSLSAFHVDPAQHFTSPPPRYTEASLVKKLESEGIGRPSTYAQIIQVIQARKYAEKMNNRFYATDLGKVVTDKLIEAFPEILQVGYTRDMEQQLDNVEDKHADWVEMLNGFYGPFKNRLDAAYEDMGHAKAETSPAPHKCPECGGDTVYRFGKNGRFLSCAGYPECKYAAPIDREGTPVEPEETDVCCPECGEPMTIRKGRFGPFLSCRRYPECKGIVKLDKKGGISLPKAPPLTTDLSCPKCGGAMNLRRGARGPWLSCSKFPKCRGRLGWLSLDEAERKGLEKALENHERENPQKVIMNSEGNPLSEGYKPETSRQDNL